MRSDILTVPASCSEIKICPGRGASAKTPRKFFERKSGGSGAGFSTDLERFDQDDLEALVRTEFLMKHPCPAKNPETHLYVLNEQWAIDKLREFASANREYLGGDDQADIVMTNLPAVASHNKCTVGTVLAGYIIGREDGMFAEIEHDKGIPLYIVNGSPAHKLYGSLFIEGLRSRRK